MADLANIPQLTHTFVNMANENDVFEDHSWMAFDSFASMYRIHCETSADIVLDDLGGYPDMQQLIAIQEAEEDIGVKPRHRRNVLQHYAEWAYRYGSKEADESEMPDATYGGDEPYVTIQAHARDIIESGDATVNDMALVFRLVHAYFSETRESFNPDLPLLEFYDCVYEEVASLVEMKEPHTNWNMMGGLLDKGRELADRDAMVELGRTRERREILDELESTDLTLDEWLEQHT